MNDAEEIEYHDYAIILHKSSGSMVFPYTTVDPYSNTLAPKLDYVSWPRLKDIVDYSACVMKNVLFITGGREKRSGVSLKQVLRYEPGRGRWFECASMKTPRSRHVSVVYNGKVFVMGGQTRKNELTAKCESYEPYMDEWHNEEELPRPRKDHQAVVSQGAVFVSGGVSPASNANDNVWRLSRYWPDPTKPQAYKYVWEHLKDAQQSHMPFKLSNHCMVLCHDRLFFIGGLCNGQNEDGVNFIRGDGTEAEVKTDARNKVATAKMMEGFRLCVQLPPENPEQKKKAKAKDDSSTKTLKRKKSIKSLTLEIPKSNWIRNLPDMPEPRSGSGSLVVGHKIYIIGGHTTEDDRGAWINTAIYYHIKKRKWMRAFPLGEGNFHEVECIQLSIPITNRDFRPMKYSECKWVLW